MSRSIIWVIEGSILLFVSWTILFGRQIEQYRNLADSFGLMLSLRAQGTRTIQKSSTVKMLRIAEENYDAVIDNPLTAVICFPF